MGLLMSHKNTVTRHTKHTDIMSTRAHSPISSPDTGNSYTHAHTGTHRQLPSLKLLPSPSEASGAGKDVIIWAVVVCCKRPYKNLSSANQTKKKKKKKKPTKQNKTSNSGQQPQIAEATALWGPFQCRPASSFGKTTYY